jgi:hypothetical protein
MAVEEILMNSTLEKTKAANIDYGAGASSRDPIPNCKVREIKSAILCGIFKKFLFINMLPCLLGRYQHSFPQNMGITVKGIRTPDR